MRPSLAPEVHTYSRCAGGREGRVEAKRAVRPVHLGQQHTRLDPLVARDHQTIAVRLERDPMGNFVGPEGETARLPRMARGGNIQAHHRILPNGCLEADDTRAQPHAPDRWSGARSARRPPAPHSRAAPSTAWNTPIPRSASRRPGPSADT